jgi:hypothetical protein
MTPRAERGTPCFGAILDLFDSANPAERKVSASVSKDRTEAVCRLIAKLVEKNAFSSEELWQLAEAIEEDKKPLLDAVDDAELLSGQEKQAFSEALMNVTRSPVNWAQVKRNLSDVSREVQQRERHRRRAAVEAAPLWNFRLRKKILIAGRSHASEISRIGDGREVGHLLRIAGSRGELVILKNGKLVARYVLDRHQSAHVALAVHRNGNTFVPVSRSFSPWECELVHLESKATLAKKCGEDWIQPIGLLWFRKELLFLVTCGQPPPNGITKIHFTSVAVGNPSEEPTWEDLSVHITGEPIWWIGAVHAHRDEVRAIVETDRGIRVCQLFHRL